jgi:hypothetical protein
VATVTVHVGATTLKIDTRAWRLAGELEGCGAVERTRTRWLVRVWQHRRDGRALVCAMREDGHPTPRVRYAGERVPATAPVALAVTRAVNALGGPEGLARGVVAQLAGAASEVGAA